MVRHILLSFGILLLWGAVAGQTKAGLVPIKPSVIDPNRAFISPREFAQVFGGVFDVTQNGKLLWEYNGVQLELNKGSTAVFSLVDQRPFNLVRPVLEKDNRTVLEAIVVYKFNCSIAPTNQSQTQVAVTCGAGQTLQTIYLKRY
jgi:hypothetical protein